MKKITILNCYMTLENFNFLVASKTLQTFDFQNVRIVDKNEIYLKFYQIMETIPQIKNVEL